MEIQKEIKFEDIENLLGSNTMVIFSNGVIKKVELPSHGIIEVVIHDKKVKRVKAHLDELF